MALQGVPVLQYDGLGATLPGDVDARLASHWIAPTALARQLVAIREHRHRVVKLYDAWARDEKPGTPGGRIPESWVGLYHGQ